MRLQNGDLCPKHPEYGGKCSKDGRCTRCASERRMEYRAKNLEKELARRAANRDRENELARKRNKDNPEAMLARSRKWRQNNPDKVRARNVAYYYKNVEAEKERIKKWRIENPEKSAAAQAAWRKNNPDKIRLTNQKMYAKADKQKRAAYSNAWKENNRDKVRQSVRKWNANNPDRTAARKAAKLNATPAWANEFFMQEAYRLARLRTKMFGFAWQVDHIVPLISHQVCGLHCEANMQVIPAKANAAKGNRWWPDMAESA